MGFFWEVFFGVGLTFQIGTRGFDELNKTVVIASAFFGARQSRMFATGYVALDCFALLAMTKIKICCSEVF